ncbi:hypothetical protein GCM10010430_27410 [Kitasatospora cystarginea]|uniref:Uncharacterized protein n=1 Tax=Kitasatospora cystarginea TaxID=58350 RepID=A0ABN3DXV5_9ACTN
MAVDAVTAHGVPEHSALPGQSQHDIRSAYDLFGSHSQFHPPLRTKAIGRLTQFCERRTPTGQR